MGCGQQHVCELRVFAVTLNFVLTKSFHPSKCSWLHQQEWGKQTDRQKDRQRDNLKILVATAVTRAESLKIQAAANSLTGELHWFGRGVTVMWQRHLNERGVYSRLKCWGKLRTKLLDWIKKKFCVISSSVSTSTWTNFWIISNLLYKSFWSGHSQIQPAHQ